MTTLFLILHKVRGEPAFDIAEQVTIGDEEGWIIPTSGHTAHPVWWIDLSDLDITERIIQTSGLIPPFSIEPDWPDHYSCNDRPAKTSLASRIPSLLSTLGFGSKPIKRRKPS